MEYFYAKIRFSSPALSALLGMAGQIYLYFGPWTFITRMGYMTWSSTARAPAFRPEMVLKKLEIYNPENVTIVEMSKHTQAGPKCSIFLSRRI